MKIKLNLFFFLLSSHLLAQVEYVSPLTNNRHLMDCDIKKHKSLSVNSTGLPFFDDFSTYKGYPSSLLWQEKDVFINTTYPVDPVNIGVATFDGLDSLGNPRNLVETSHGEADFLTSKPMDLSSYSNAYFSFYIQAQGLGNEPEGNDIFHVQFLDSSFSWQTVWDTTGHALSDFKKIKIDISDAVFLHDDFQFRFFNMASLSGNFDHWHVDNVLLTESADLYNDNEDIAFVYETSKMLNFYYSVPWKHFDNNRIAYMSNTMDTWLRNNYLTAQSVDYRYDIFDNNNDLVFHYPSSGPTRNDEIPIFSGTNFSYTNDSPAAITVGSNAFPSPSEELERNQYTIIQSIATDDDELFKENDTLSFIQSFDNFYALDDGSAEASYGINAEGGKVAMLFNIAQTDTLKAVQLHFTQNFEDASATAFSITLWKSESGIPSEMIYQSQVFYPEYTNSINGFYEYVLENPISISGSVFVGWQQYYDNIINIGLDKNNYNNDRMFYNLGSQWSQSNCADCDGTWMIRPVFGNLTISETPDYSDFKFSLYPNPADNVIVVENQDPFLLSISTINGQVLLHHECGTKQNIDISSYDRGLYIVKIKSQNKVGVQKLIVQ
ncbi:MAG: T9SS type A sorting domain-containing protein [Flavobacteriales bacterium]